MQTYILADWTAIFGAAGAIITQDEMGWLDLAPFQDVVVYVDCREATNATLTIETAPAKDDALFKAIATTTLAAAATPAIFSNLMLSSTVPLARYLRWKLTAAAAWDANFRLFVSANAPGM